MNVVEKLVNWIVKWLSFGPLKGYRTKLLSVLMVLLAGLKYAGYAPWLDDKTYTAVMALLTATAVRTASVHTG